MPISKFQRFNPSGARGPFTEQRHKCPEYRVWEKEQWRQERALVAKLLQQRRDLLRQQGEVTWV